MISLNNIEWKVETVPPDSDLLNRSDGSKTVGVCDSNVHTIYVSETLEGDFLKKVMCHEIAHAAMFSYEVDLTVDQEELIADIIATYGEEIITVTNKLFLKINKGRHN